MTDGFYYFCKTCGRLSVPAEDTKIIIRNMLNARYHSVCGKEVIATDIAKELGMLSLVAERKLISSIRVAAKPGGYDASVEAS